MGNLSDEPTLGVTAFAHGLMVAPLPRLVVDQDTLRRWWAEPLPEQVAHLVMVQPSTSKYNDGSSAGGVCARR
jgi:hypothetical protein